MLWAVSRFALHSSGALSLGAGQLGTIDRPDDAERFASLAAGVYDLEQAAWKEAEAQEASLRAELLRMEDARRCCPGCPDCVGIGMGAELRALRTERDAALLDLGRAQADREALALALGGTEAQLEAHKATVADLTEQVERFQGSAGGAHVEVTRLRHVLINAGRADLVAPLPFEVPDGTLAGAAENAAALASCPRAWPGYCCACRDRLEEGGVKEGACLVCRRCGMKEVES